MTCEWVNNEIKYSWDKIQCYNKLSALKCMTVHLYERQYNMTNDNMITLDYK